jgi:hypothetical protein
MQSSRRAATLLLFLSLAASARNPSSAQPPRDSAFSALRIRVAGARNVNREPLHDFWRAGTGGVVAVTTPFYFGTVGAGATLIPFRARDSGRPSFRALLLSIDWGIELAAPGPLRGRAAARVGDFVMIVENPDVWLESESELFAGGELSASIGLRRGLAATLAGSLARVHTRPPIDLAVLTLGLEYSTRTPGWLRAFLE